MSAGRIARLYIFVQINNLLEAALPSVAAAAEPELHLSPHSASPRTCMGAQARVPKAFTGMLCISAKGVQSPDSIGGSIDEAAHELPCAGHSVMSDGKPYRCHCLVVQA